MRKSDTQTQGEDTLNEETSTDGVDCGPMMNGHQQRPASKHKQSHSILSQQEEVAEETSPQDGILNERLI